MRNVLALIGLVVVVFVGAGWYFGWYKFAVTPTIDGKQQIQVEVDTRKIGEDAKKFGETVNTAVQNAQPKDEKSSFVGPPAPEGMSKPTPPTVGPVSFTFPGPSSATK